MRSTIVLTFCLLAAAIGIGAQGGPPPRAASTGMSTNKTWSDADYAALMKQIGPGAAMLRKSLDGQTAGAAEEQASKLEELFDQVEAFWDSRKVSDAKDWAKEASDHANHIEDAAKAKDFGKANEHLKLLMATCQTCHTKYRDKAPDGTYMIKKQ
jgi:cytochrome c556